jgi:hypothetical protein
MERADSKSEYEYLEGPQSSVTLPGDEPLQFVIRVDDDPRALKVRRNLCHFVERLMESANGRRYRTKSRVKLEQTVADIVPGLNPKKPKHGTLKFSLRAPDPLPPGEYVVVMELCEDNARTLGPQYGAFRVAGRTP